MSLVSHYPATYPGVIDQFDPDALRKVTDMLGDAAMWPAVDRSLPEFEQQALADCRLATSMDLLAARRGLIAQFHRAGVKLPAEDFENWADSMAAMREGFEGLWRLRFRPSRIADNLKLMRAAEKECRQLAGKAS